MKVQNISSPSFQMAPGNYINPRALEQKAMLQGILADTFEHETNIVKATENSIKAVFPNMNFILASIDSLKNNPAIPKIKPLMKVMTSYDEGEPSTYFFMNGQKMIDILNDDIDEDIYGSAKAKKMYEEIADRVVLANEPYFISRVVSDFTARLFSQDEVNPATVNGAIRESLVKYDIDIDNKVVGKEDINIENEYTMDKESNMVGIHYTPQNVETTMYVNDKTSQNIRYTAIPQNFANVLCANSKMFNKVKMDVKKDKCQHEVMIDWGSLFVQLSQSDHNFLKQPLQFKSQIYALVLKGILASFPDEMRESIFKQILSQTAQETLAYTLSPNILGMLETDKKYVPIGEHFRDFHEFLNAVNFTDFMI